MDEKEDTAIVATYGLTVTARADGPVVRSGEAVEVPLNDEMVTEVETALSAKWPNLTFKARSERTDR